MLHDQAADLPESGLTVVLEPADSERSQLLQSAFFADIADRYPGWSPTSSQSVELSELGPPSGVWLVAYLGEVAVGCGGLQRLDNESAEVRRLFLDERVRGHGIGRTLLTALEKHARTLGYDRLLLTTGDRQPEALGLFRAVGYHEVAPFTDGRFTSHWMEKHLASDAAPSGGQR